MHKLTASIIRPLPLRKVDVEIKLRHRNCALLWGAKKDITIASGLFLPPFYLMLPDTIATNIRILANLEHSRQ